jgi:hypothetical protein
MKLLRFLRDIGEFISNLWDIIIDWITDLRE